MRCRSKKPFHVPLFGICGSGQWCRWKRVKYGKLSFFFFFFFFADCVAFGLKINVYFRPLLSFALLHVAVNTRCRKTNWLPLQNGKIALPWFMCLRQEDKVLSKQSGINMILMLSRSFVKSDACTCYLSSIILTFLYKSTKCFIQSKIRDLLLPYHWHQPDQRERKRKRE